MNKKIKIGFDFDRVFVDYPPIIPDALIEYLYKRKNGHIHYRIPGAIEKKIRIISHHPILRKPINVNIEVVKKLSKNKKVDMYIVSSRFSFLKSRTEEWNKKNKLSEIFKDTFFNYNDLQPHIFKENIIKKERIDKFIDDDFDLLLYLAPRNPNVEFYLIGSVGKNKKLPKNICEIRDLRDFEQKFI